jgi:hypothetical protein
LQCGSYIFMDADYGRNLDRDGAPTKAFEPSLFVWATVMSRPTQDRAIVDAGLKALAFDSGPPLVCDEPAATYERASDEHGRLSISVCTNRLGLGDKIRLVPSHCDPTVNLYDWYVAIRGNRVEQLWPITVLGAVYTRSFRGCPMRHVGPVLVIAVICGCGVRPGARPARCTNPFGAARRCSGPGSRAGCAAECCATSIPGATRAEQARLAVQRSRSQ